MTMTKPTQHRLTMTMCTNTTYILQSPTRRESLCYSDLSRKLKKQHCLKLLGAAGPKYAETIH